MRALGAEVERLPRSRRRCPGVAGARRLVVVVVVVATTAGVVAMVLAAVPMLPSWAWCRLGVGSWR